MIVSGSTTYWEGKHSDMENLAMVSPDKEADMAEENSKGGPPVEVVHHEAEVCTPPPLEPPAFSDDTCTASGLDLQDLEDDDIQADEEQLKMVAGLAAFQLESKVFSLVLPKSLIHPYISPRTIKDMENIINKFNKPESQDKLEGAAEKWEDLKTELDFTRGHDQVIQTLKSDYLHVHNPLKVMAKVHQRCSEAEVRRALQARLPDRLRQTGEDILVMMGKLDLIPR
ncbi:Hypp4844 [Branchiostoma lanceolatum]|uniref:Hypp4844 protein n=1 Tax=Branchiostoma lanceolatum TaxID=7740 RepID=A0A8K0AEE6_BRALA|nr:Hypp4844 [Branchiostoma lanceolatum]